MAVSTLCFAACKSSLAFLRRVKDLPRHVERVSRSPERSEGETSFYLFKILRYVQNDGRFSGSLKVILSFLSLFRHSEPIGEESLLSVFA